MNGLSLHCGTGLVERGEVFEAPTPEPTETHFPIPHSLLLEELETHLLRNNLRVVQEAHALTADRMRYFGLLEISAIMLDDPSVKPDYNLVIGLRNAHDCKWSAALAMGNRVFVCDNLAFSGEVLIGRKHTRHIARDIPLLIPRAFAALSHERVRMEQRIEAYKETHIRKIDANDLILRACVDARALPITKLPNVVQEWRTPRHEEFKAANAWCLANAFTEILKSTGNPRTLENRTRALYDFLDTAIGLNLPTREELLTSGIEDTVTSNDAFGR